MPFIVAKDSSLIVSTSLVWKCVLILVDAILPSEKQGDLVVMLKCLVWV